MRILLDTHSFLWFITANPKLSSRSCAMVEDLENEVFLSIASLWEIAIKAALGKLELAKPFAELFPAQVILNQIELLAIDVGHLTTLTELPLRHRDPFDRLLISQAMTENLSVITKDSAFHEYPVRVIW
jgi:PIN domain nuclease of toxin-antitoxin system